MTSQIDAKYAVGQISIFWDYNIDDEAYLKNLGEDIHEAVGVGVEGFVPLFELWELCQ